MIPALLVLQAVSAAADPAYAAAVEARLAGRTSEAITAFERLSRERASDADVWLNLGLAYSAAGRYPEAERALETALRLAPGYPDVQLALARTALFRGDRRAAQERLAPLQAARPDDPEVRALSAQIADVPDAEKRWRMDLAHAHSRLTNDLGEWRTTTFALGRTSGEWSVSGLVEHTERFGREDLFFEGAVARRFDRSDLFLAVGGAADADFRPEGSIRAGGSTAIGADGPWRVRLGVEAAYARYASGDVRSLQPVLTVARGQAELALRAYNTLDERDEFRSGYSARGTWSASERLQLSVGWADAPESSEGVTVQVEALSVGAAVAVTEDTRIRVDYTHETRPAYERDEWSVSLTRRF